MTSLGGQCVDCPSWRCTESQAQQQIEGQFHPGDEGPEASTLISLMSSHAVREYHIYNVNALVMA